MSDPVPLSASDLRQAMRDPRYWQAGHPERQRYQAWVGNAFQQMYGTGGKRDADGLVWVAPYARTRDGVPEQVSGHFRSGGGRRGGQEADRATAARVSVEDDPGGGVERRTTVRDASGALIGSCESLFDGSQYCTLGMPDGRVVVQGLEPGAGELVPVAVPAVALYGFPLLLGAGTAFYNALQAQRQRALENGTASDTPFMLFYRGFEGTEEGARVTVGTLSDERVRQFCPKTGEFEATLTEIAESTPRQGMSPQQWGTAVHIEMRDQLTRRYRPESNVVRAELSLIGGEEETYGKAGTTRLDVLHRVEGTDTICAYDIKTGQALLGREQAARIYAEAHAFGRANRIPNPRVMIIELRRTP